MSRDDEIHEDDGGARMGKAIVRGILVGIPSSLVFFTVAVALITGQSLIEALESAVLPGVMFGAFAGGFAGVAATSD